jgi:hypothetical protein
MGTRPITRRDQKELFVYGGCGGVLHKYPHVINRNEVKVQVSGVKLEISLILILIKGSPNWGLYQKSGVILFDFLKIDPLL